jgi:thiol-disulfide isomerase/thioredoxin
MRKLIVLMLYVCSFGLQASPSLTLLNGKDIPFSALKGRWIMINYWASWCGPCLDEIKEFNRLLHEYPKEVAIFAVNYDMVGQEEQRALSVQYDLHYPSLAGNPARSLRLGPIRGVPVTYVFNPEGKLIDTLHGGQSYENLVKAIRK